MVTSRAVSWAKAPPTILSPARCRRTGMGHQAVWSSQDDGRDGPYPEVER